MMVRAAAIQARRPSRFLEVMLSCGSRHREISGSRDCSSPSNGIDSPAVALPCVVGVPYFHAMASTDDITSLSAVEMAAHIRRKDLSAREVLEAHLARIERINPGVNAIVTLVPEKAHAWAREADEKQASGAALG